jgi:myosin heavy subunit
MYIYSRYLNQSGVTSIAGLDDAAEYRDVVSAMRTVGFDAAGIAAVMRVVAALLHLGNVTFDELPNDASRIAVGSGSGSGSGDANAEDGKRSRAGSRRALEKAAELLGLAPEKLEFALTSRTLTTASET